MGIFNFFSGGFGGDGSGGIYVTPDWTPPSIKYKDADEITVPEGLYYPVKHRVKGQYKGAGSISAAWDLSSPVDVDVDAPGTLIGGKSTGGTGSWYSLFMTSASTFLVLPFVRVDVISFGSGETTINPAAHDDGTTADNTFVTANDDFNGYRLMYISFDSDDGTIWEISDTVNSTPDEIKVASDITSIVSAGDWLQMLPADGNYVYLGTIRIDNSGNLRQFTKAGWEYQFQTRVSINLNKSTTAANTDLAQVVPPNAKIYHGGVYAQGGAGSIKIQITFYSGTSGTDDFGSRRLDTDANSSNSLASNWSQSFVLTAVSLIRNKVFKDIGAGDVAADYGNIDSIGWEE